MNSNKHPKTSLYCISLALVLINGCIEFPKSRPQTGLKVNLSKYTLRPKVHFITTFSCIDCPLVFGVNLYTNDTLRKIVEKVTKGNKLFDSYSFEADGAKAANYRIELLLSRWVPWYGNVDTDNKLLLGLKETLYTASFGLMPLPVKVRYSLTAQVYDGTDRELYAYSCRNDSTATQYSFIPPSGMIEKMVKEALFNVIDNSGIIESYEIEPSGTDDFKNSNP